MHSLKLSFCCAGMSEVHDAQQAVALEEQAHAHAQAQLQAAAQAQNLAAKAQAHAHAQVGRAAGHSVRERISLAATTNAALLDAHATGEAKDLCLTTMLCAVPAEPVILSFDTDLGCKLDRVQAHAQAQAQSLANQAHNLQAHAQQLDVESTFGHSTPGMAQPQVGLCAWLMCTIPLVLRPACTPLSAPACLLRSHEAAGSTATGAVGWR